MYQRFRTQNSLPKYLKLKLKLQLNNYLNPLTFNFLLFSIEDISTIKRKPFLGQTRKKTPSESSQIHQSFDSPIHQSNMSLTESDFINQALTGGGRISRSSSSNQLGSIRTDSPKVNITVYHSGIFI